jgi:hypothetical protein
MLNEAISKNYMLAGYAVIITVLALYLVSLFIRWRNLKRDFQSLKEIRKNDKYPGL